MKAKLLVVVLNIVSWSGLLQAGKTYYLLTSEAISGVSLRVPIKSRTLDKMPPALSSYFKKVIIDRLAHYKNPLEAHIALSRYWQVSASIIPYLSHSSPIKNSHEDSYPEREVYENKMTEFNAYNPSISTKWEDRHRMAKKLTAQAIAVSKHVTKSLRKNKAFWNAFAAEDLQRGPDLQNFFFAKLQEFNDLSGKLESIGQQVGTDSKYPERSMEVAQDLSYVSVAGIANGNSDRQGQDFSFLRAVQASLLHKIISDGNDKPFPWLWNLSYPDQGEDQQSALDYMNAWIRVYLPL